MPNPAPRGSPTWIVPCRPEGLAEAEAAGRWLAEQGLVPDRVLCSPARRARETLEAVLGTIGYVEQRLEDRIYEATSGTLAELADANRDAERLLIVGHNPGLEHLAALMYSGQSGDYRGMPPAAVVVLTLPVDASVEPGVAHPFRLLVAVTLRNAPSPPLGPAWPGRLVCAVPCWSRPPTASTRHARALVSKCAPAGATCWKACSPATRAK